MRIGIIGYGYWGKIIESKLNNVIINPKGYDLDWVFVVTPPNTHYKIVKKYLNKGINVFCEKPLTLDYKSSKKLIELANKNNVLLYIDNLFLFRKELIDLKLSFSKEIEFIWFKKGPYKDSLFNDLLYHDLYILIYLIGINKITNIKYVVNNKDKLLIVFNYGNLIIKINYDRNKKTKVKLIKTEHQTIDLSFPKNDPLQESINLFLSKNIDVEKNHKISLETIKLLKHFK